jgi:hypothetical protein
MRSISKLKISVKHDFQEWLEKNLSNCRYIPRKRLECNDGFNMSIQGGENSYSKPRQFGTNFIEMEVGFPSEYEELIKDYTNSEYYTDAVYPYVPVSLIIEVIEKHGGIKKD